VAITVTNPAAALFWIKPCARRWLPRGGNSRFKTCHVRSKTPHMACFARSKTVLKCFKMVEKRLKDVLFMIYRLLLIPAHMLQLCRLEATNLLQIKPKYVNHLAFQNVLLVLLFQNKGYF
jgi:hypothetical protein